ncbi:putative lipoprotein [Myxococcus hansupus]|uniref:Putative lipoprotein n=1 Tax=Pseudomyxococcus hansupus TaxID=1297742 RepID=A0A0H4XL86_9BACT|nr:putative lipoprotein [Myxococcus hansupus]
MYVPAVPRPRGKLIKHHLFPQEPRLAAWFRAAGIDIHQFTMVVPEHVHWRIHSGKGMGPGGAWNNAWRRFVVANPRPPSKDVIMRHAIELAFRFELSGPVVPYNVPITPGMGGSRIEAL